MRASRCRPIVRSTPTTARSRACAARSCRTTTQVYYNQGFLDLELHFPIQSEASPFSMRVLFGRGLANRTATYINFIRPDGGVRAFRIHDDTPLVRLDPNTHSGGMGISHRRLLSVPRRPRPSAVRHRAGAAVPARARPREAVRGVRDRAFDRARLAGVRPGAARYVVRAHHRRADGAVAGVRVASKTGSGRVFVPTPGKTPPDRAFCDIGGSSRSSSASFTVSASRSRCRTSLQFAGSHPIAALVGLQRRPRARHAHHPRHRRARGELLFFARPPPSAPASSCRRCSSATSAGTG